MVVIGGHIESCEGLREATLVLDVQAEHTPGPESGAGGDAKQVILEARHSAVQGLVQGYPWDARGLQGIQSLVMLQVD